MRTAEPSAVGAGKTWSIGWAPSASCIEAPTAGVRSERRTRPVRRCAGLSVTRTRSRLPAVSVNGVGAHPFARAVIVRVGGRPDLVESGIDT